MKTSKTISALVMVSALAFSSAASAADRAPAHGQTEVSAKTAKLVVAGPVTIHAYSAFSGGTMYAALAVTGTDADCKSQPANGTAVRADRIVDFQVAVGQVACLAADRAIELLWHAQKDAPVSSTVMVAGR